MCKLNKLTQEKDDKERGERMNDKKRITLRLPDELYGALKGKAWVEIPNSISFKIFRTTFYIYFIGFGWWTVSKNGCGIEDTWYDGVDAIAMVLSILVFVWAFYEEPASVGLAIVILLVGYFLVALLSYLLGL